MNDMAKQWLAVCVCVCVDVFLSIHKCAGRECVGPGVKVRSLGD